MTMGHSGSLGILSGGYFSRLLEGGSMGDQQRVPQPIWRILARDHDGELVVGDHWFQDRAQADLAMEGLRMGSTFDELWVEQGEVRWP